MVLRTLPCANHGASLIERGTVITDFELLERVLDEIDSATEMVVLHRERDVAVHEVSSDVDIAIASRPLAVLSVVAPRLEDRGVLPILVFHYDRGAYSFFFSNRDGSGGAQVDVVHDPAGVGRYGFKTDALLANRHDGARWPTTSHLDEALYVLRKRQVKRDMHGLLRARDHADEFDARRLQDRCQAIFSPHAASAVRGALAGRFDHATGTRQVWLSRVMRPSRLTRRCGYWVHLPAGPTEPAHELARRMSRIVNVRITEPRCRAVLRDLWRPRLVVSFGSLPLRFRPDLVIQAGHPVRVDDLTRELIGAMHQKALRQFRLDRRVPP